MNYLTSTLKIPVRYETWELRSQLPFYILDCCTIETAYLNEIKALFVTFQELPVFSALKKYIKRIQTLEPIPVVLVLHRLTARQREQLISAGIPFVVPERQIYLPFMGTVLSEHCDPELDEVEKLMPSAQLLLFYLIYQKKQQIPMGDAVDALQFSPMTITRAVRQLESAGLLRTEKNGVKKTLILDSIGHELFDAAQPYLINPVRKRLYIPADSVGNECILASYSAISEKTMLNPPKVTVYAARKIEIPENQTTKRLLDADTQVQLELWHYPPEILSKNGIADPLSLALSLQKDTDERIEEAVEEMLNELWEDNNG